MDHVGRAGLFAGISLIITSVVGCKSPVSITLCSAASQQVEFVVRFTRAEPREITGVLPPGARRTVKAEPGGDGDYSLELHHGASVQHHPGRYYTTEGGQDTFTVQDDLSLNDGCSTAVGSTPASSSNR
jgi:hypothetical protein